MERSPLDAATAAAFLRRLGEHLDHNINIMDRDGVIIASRDLGRVGSYHEAAHRLVARGAGIEEVEAGPALPAGVKPGVNLPIVYKGAVIGVVGVTGEPREVGPLAYAVKTSLESMVELELYKNQALRRQDRKNLFINYLLYEDEAPLGVAEGLARKLGYEAGLQRAALLLRLPESLAAEEALAGLKEAKVLGSEDISSVAPDGALLVFKALRLTGEGILAEFGAQVGAFAQAVAAALGLGGREPVAAPPAGRPGGLRAYAGAFQTELARYRGSYRQALWLASRFPAPPGGPVLVYDHLGEYLANRLPRSELVDTLASLAALLPADFSRGFRDSVEALFESAFNGKEAAARLGVHRNTLSSRLERIRLTFGLDLRHDPRARDLLPLLARYLELAEARPGRDGRADAGK